MLLYGYVCLYMFSLGKECSLPWLVWDVDQVVEHHPVHQKVMGLLPGQDTFLGCGLHLHCGVCRKLQISDSLSSMVFLSLSSFSL